MSRFDVKPQNKHQVFSGLRTDPLYFIHFSLFFVEILLKLPAFHLIEIWFLIWLQSDTKQTSKGWLKSETEQTSRGGYKVIQSKHQG